MATHFEKLLDQYPVTPYLDTRESFIRWTHHIHNKINELLEKKKISLAEFYEQYYDHYKPKEVKFKEYYKIRAKVIYLVIVMLFIAAIIYFYNK